MSIINDNYKAYPNSDFKGIPIPHEIARPAGLYIFQPASNAKVQVAAAPADIEILAVWSNSDVLVIYSDAEPVWAYNSLIENCVFCPAYTTTVIEANKDSSLWLIPISPALSAGAYTVTLQQMQAWKTLGQNAQQTIVG